MLWIEVEYWKNYKNKLYDTIILKYLESGIIKKDYPENELYNLKMQELKEICNKHGIKKSGKKEDLIDRENY